MLTVLLRWLALTLLPLAIAASLSCGGASPAPINGAYSLGAVSVAIAPATMSIATGTTQAFTATVNNSNVSGVQWLVNGIPGGNGAIGTIDSSGNFTAPQFIPNPANVTITAIADADNTKSGKAQVTIVGAQVPAHVSMSPTGTVYMQVGTSLPLSAAVTGPADTGIIWEVVNNSTVVTNGNASFGTITPGANGSATYKAPAAVPPGGTVTIRAASHAQPNVFASCTVVISLGPPPIETVVITPVAAVVQVQTSYQFSATIIGTTDQSVTWAIRGTTGAGDSAHGTISQAGLYTAPATVPAPPAPNTVTITATSQAQSSASASATVTIVPCAAQFCVSILISPTSVPSLDTGSEQLFTATVANGSTPNVSWYVNGILNGNATYGTIAQSPENAGQATYFAPSTVPAQNPVIVSVVPVAAPNISASASVTIVQSNVTVTVTPSKPCIEISQAQPFQAAVTGTSNEDVNWYVNGILGGNTTVGTIGNTGSNNTTYTAPATVPNPSAVAIKAVSVADTGASGSASATIVANPTINLSPTAANVQETLSQNITATPCTGLSNLSLLWYANGEQGGDPTVNGTIAPLDSTTLVAQYVAPPTIPNPPTVAITAVDQNSGTHSTTAIMTIIPLVQQVTISVNPTSTTLMPSQQQPFTATVNNTSDQIVNWTLSGPSGGCNPTICGTITAQTDGGPATYVAPASIPADPNITVTATADASPHPQATAAVTIAILPASISIAPANPTVQAGSTTSTTFVATVENVDPNTTEVSWTLECNSEAPAGENCGTFFPLGEAGPGCLSDGLGHDICLGGEGITDLATVNMSYLPPKELGSNFEANYCTSSAGTNGLVPLTAQFNASNCVPSGVCSATVCITVTPP
ncbi:MAG TPA: hypothetical protein VEF05_08205 [Terriglobales bacterium]|nr:hypothetical protein [Terriglobales bacterium]